MNAVTPFFRKDFVMNEIKQRNEAFPKYIPNSKNEVIEVVVNGFLCLGHEVTTSKGTFKVLMQYVENEVGEIAIAKNEWVVIHNGVGHEGFPTLQEVFDLINK